MRGVSSHKTILVSTSLMGTQQIVRLLVGVIQSKVVAVLLGTAGTGAFGFYASVQQLAQSLFGLGVHGSGVRQIAASQKKDEQGNPSEEIRILILVSALLAAVSFVFLFSFRSMISLWTFGNQDHASDIVYIAGSAAVGLITLGFCFSLQGVRRIRDLTMAYMVGAVSSAVTAVLLVYGFGYAGIAPAFLASACCNLLAAIWYFRKIGNLTVHTSTVVFWQTFGQLIRLGSGFMFIGIFASLSAYGVRAILVQRLGLEAAGLYQAAWMLATFYCTMVLQAMGTDFFPRISAESSDHSTVNRLVNEQAEVGLLIVVPGLLMFAVAAELVIRILYTPEFVASCLVARWMLLAMLVRASGWPLAYVPLALNKPRFTVLTEGLVAVVLVGLSLLFVSTVGLTGAGVAFFLSSLVYTVTGYIVSRRLMGFRWSDGCKKMMVVIYPACLSVFALLFHGSKVAVIGAWTIAIITSIGCGWVALRLVMGSNPFSVNAGTDELNG